MKSKIAGFIFASIAAAAQPIVGPPPEFQAAQTTFYRDVLPIYYRRAVKVVIG